MTVEGLKQALYLLAKLRESMAQAKKDREGAHKDMLATLEGKEWANNDANYKTLSKSEKSAWALAGEKAVGAYNGQDKQVTEGASVAEYTAQNVIVPDRSAAEAWCREFAQALFVLDIGAFNDLVLGGKVPEAIAHIEIVTTVKPLIGSDLSFLLEEDESE